MTVNQSGTTNDVDCTTLDKKLMMGYQGWFAYPNDGSPLPEENCWWHWFQGNDPTGSNLVVDMLPDTSELSTLGTGICETGMSCSSGKTILYSAYNPSVVDLHFKWMREYNLDGVMLQRFVCDLHEKNSIEKAFRDQVALNVKTSADKPGRRAFCIMYDISNSNESTFVDDLINDWDYLVNDPTMKITENLSYLKHNDKPLLAIWGLGFNDHPGTATHTTDIITHFKNKAQVTLMGGVPSNWRTPGSPIDGDSKTNDPNQPADPKWLDIYESFDVLSPWTVGDTGADNKTDRIKQDLNELKNLKNRSGRQIDYMPVVFPGYSWKNAGQKEQPQTEHKLNQIPRDGGRFWWRQVYNAIQAFKEVNPNNMMIYGAMFDEVNEGTAMFKLVADQKDLPTQAELVPLNVPGESPGNLTSDYYLWLAGETNRRLRDGIEFTSTMPTRDQPTPQLSLFRRVRSLLNRRS